MSTNVSFMTSRSMASRNEARVSITPPAAAPELAGVGACVGAATCAGGAGVADSGGTACGCVVAAASVAARCFKISGVSSGGLDTAPAASAASGEARGAAGMGAPRAARCAAGGAAAAAGAAALGARSTTTGGASVAAPACWPAGAPSDSLFAKAPEILERARQA